MGRPEEAGYSLDNRQQHDDAPPYSPSTTTQVTGSAIFTQPSRSASLQSRSSVTWTRFAIPTKTSSLSSGFPFHQRLFDLRVTHDQWHLFTEDVITAAKMTPAEDYLAWTTGIASGTLTSPFLLIFAPVVGYYSGKMVHKKTLVKTVKEKLREEGGLRAVLKRWNETVFKAMGFQIWLELPRVSSEMGSDHTLDLGSEIRPRDEKQRKKEEKQAARRFRLIVVPEGDADFANQVTGNGLVGGASDAETENLRRPEVAEMDDADTQPPAYGASEFTRREDVASENRVQNDIERPISKDSSEATAVYQGTNANTNPRQTTGSNQFSPITPAGYANTNQGGHAERPLAPSTPLDDRRSWVQGDDADAAVMSGGASRSINGHNTPQSDGPRQDAPLSGEIRYSRVGGFTNS